MKIRLIVAALTLGLQALTAHAATLSLDTGMALPLQPSQTGSMTFSFTNNVGPISDFLSWTLGIQVLPAGSVTGTVALGTLTLPTVNPMPTTQVDITQPTLSSLANSGTINGSTDFYQIGLQGSGSDSISSSTSYNMGTLSFTASGDAVGTWNVYAVQQGGAFFQSWWFNSSITDFDFGNLPRTAGDSSLLLGSITVPEPNSLFIAEVIGTLAAGYAWGRRRRVTTA